MAPRRQLLFAALCVVAATGAGPGCVARSTVTRAPLPEGGRELRDLAYLEGPARDEQKHRLNLFIPPGPGPHPVVVFVHGGGWVFGDRAELTDPYTKLGRRFAARGIMTAVVSYRLSPRHSHPAHIEDVARAVAWTFANAEAHGGDPSRLFLMGHSAGAQLVSLAALDPRWLAAHALSPDRLAGVIAVSPPVDVHHLGRSLPTALALIQPAFGRSPEVWREVSPTTWLHARASTPPPFLVAWADGDFAALRTMAPRFAGLLRRHGGRVTTHEATFKGHFSIVTDLGEPGDPLGDAVESFVRATRTEATR